ncbi:MAG: serine/threonine-protein kinase [Myxococcaceae bacterium]
MVERVGRYELVRHLATGGMGEVFLARQSGPAGFTRTAVVKRLLPHLARDAAFVEMFLNEARVVSLLSHPHIAQILELGEADGTWFIAMEFIHGRSLQQLEKALAEKQRVLAPALAVRILVQALRGLEHAHALRIDGKPSPVIHRDLSPDNILVGFNGVARLIDFGIARAADTVSTTRTGTVKGKFSYMAPERFDTELSREVDPRTDVWAMGVVAWEALAGMRPFRGKGDPQLISAILHTEAPPLHEANPAVPPELGAIVMRALAKRPEARFQSAGEFADALEAWLRASGQVAGETEVASLLRSVFPGAADENPALSSSSSELMPPTVISQGPAAPQRRPWWIVVVLGVGLAGGGAWVAMRPTPAAAPVVVVPPPIEVKAEPKVEPAPAGKPGRVSFRVKPWAEIWEGARKLGTTPNVPIERPAGEYTFTLKHPDYPPRDIKVQVLADSEVSMKVDLTAP